MWAKIKPVTAKEIRVCFNSPIATVVMATFLFFTSAWFFILQQFFATDIATMRPFFTIVPVLFMIILPAVTMRSWAEEKKMGTLEVLMTLPYREGELVLGKYAAAMFLLLLLMVLTLPMPLLLSRFGNFDPGELLGQYLGVLLLGSAEISVGLFISAFASNQISSFILGCFTLLALTLVGQLPAVFGLPVGLSSVLNQLSLGYHYTAFQKGLLDSRDLSYYLIVTGLFLYLNAKVLVFRKWM